MANAIWPLARKKFLEGDLQWKAGGDSFSIAILDSTYTYSPSHEFRDDLTGVIATAALTGIVSTGNGVADADDASVSGAAYGDVITQIVIYRNVGTAATDDLIYHGTHQVDGTAIYRVSDGTNPIVFSWSNNTGRIFQI